MLLDDGASSLAHFVLKQAASRKNLGKTYSSPRRRTVFLAVAQGQDCGDTRENVLLAASLLGRGHLSRPVAPPGLWRPHRD